MYARPPLSGAVETNGATAPAGDAARPIDREVELWTGAIVAVAIAAFATLWLFAGYDDNRLLSWHWVRGQTTALAPFAALGVGLAVAVLLSRWPLDGRAVPLALFAAGAFAAVPLWSAPETIVDAARYFTQAKHLALFGPGFFAAEWGREIAAWTDLPLVPFLYGLIFMLFGEERIYVQLFTTLLFAATIVLTYGIGKVLWHARLGMHAALLLLAMPYLLTQVPLMLVDVPTMFFVTAAVFSLIQALARGGAWVLLAAVAVSAAALTKYSAWLLLAAAFLAVGVSRRRQPAALARAGLVAALGGAAFGLLLWTAQDVIAAQLTLLRDYQAPGLSRWRESLASTFLFQIHPFITAAALSSVIIAWARKDARYVIIGGTWLAIVLVGSGRIRYLLPAFPLLALLAAYGLEALRLERLKRVVVGCAVASSLAIALFGYLPFLRHTSAANLADAGRLLDRLEGETVEVITLAQTGAPINPAVSVPLLDLHTAKHIVYRHVPTAPPAGNATSALRFTWESSGARYYEVPARGAPPVATVVIAAQRGQALPPAFAARLGEGQPIATFDQSEGVFGYQTLVAVHRPQFGL